MDLKIVFDSIAQKLAIDFEYLTSQIQHRPSKGRVREVEVVEEFLRLYLPRNIGIGHGEIVASNNVVSNETDIVFYEANSCPPLIAKTGYQVFPVECVHGIMEVKSKLDSNEIQDAFSKISSLKQFPKTAFEPQSGAVQYSYSVYDKKWYYFPTTGFVFAYDSIDLRTLRNKLDQLNSSVAVHHRIDFVTVLKKGLIINWDDETGMSSLTPSSKTRLRAVESENPLLLTVVFLQQILQNAWMPSFRIRDYLRHVEYGSFLD